MNNNYKIDRVRPNAELFNNKGISGIVYPAYSANMKAIERFCDMLGREVDAHLFSPEWV